MGRKPGGGGNQSHWALERGGGAGARPAASDAVQETGREERVWGRGTRDAGGVLRLAASADRVSSACLVRVCERLSPR